MTDARGRLLAKGRDALATLVGGGERGCKTKLVWTDWSHLMLNHEITPTPDGSEFVTWRWVEPTWMIANVIEFRRVAYERVLGTL